MPKNGEIYRKLGKQNECREINDIKYTHVFFAIFK